METRLGLQEQCVGYTTDMIPIATVAFQKSFEDFFEGWSKIVTNLGNLCNNLFIYLTNVVSVN